ncbi:NAD(P)H-binding protein [Kineosporia mesophila]|uniref:NAD(P)H-binding protein n=1 Tax=Kineosporia mesophila TaxID=566012 RepID=A0ABP6Z8H7_9ACTN|nr:NAD(P)H-binding protein [Kineosporia mesophila]
MIVVTAPTGNIGAGVVRGLLENDEQVRVVVRDPARLDPQVAGRVDVVVGSHADADVVDRAFEGADAVFWLVPADDAATSMDEAYSGFARAGIESLTTRPVPRVVGISALGRGTPVAGRAGHVTATLAMDDLIAATGVPYRALTNPSFMDNWLWATGSIKSTGTYFGPYVPDLAMPSVATQDIAAVAVDLLRDSSWTGFEERPVLGPENLTFAGMAQIASDVLGRPVEYQQIPGEDFKATMMKFGNSEAIAQGLLDMALAKNEGLDLNVARTAGNSTPTTFAQWCADVLKPAVDG